MSKFKTTKTFIIGSGICAFASTIAVSTILLNNTISHNSNNNLIQVQNNQINSRAVFDPSVPLTKTIECFGKDFQDILGDNDLLKKGFLIDFIELFEQIVKPTLTKYFQDHFPTLFNVDTTGYEIIDVILHNVSVADSNTNSIKILFSYNYRKKPNSEILTSDNNTFYINNLKPSPLDLKNDPSKTFLKNFQPILQEEVTKQGRFLSDNEIQILAAEFLNKPEHLSEIPSCWVPSNNHYWFSHNDITCDMQKIDMSWTPFKLEQGAISVGTNIIFPSMNIEVKLTAPKLEVDKIDYNSQLFSQIFTQDPILVKGFISDWKKQENIDAMITLFVNFLNTEGNAKKFFKMKDNIEISVDKTIKPRVEINSQNQTVSITLEMQYALIGGKNPEKQSFTFIFYLRDFNYTSLNSNAKNEFNLCSTLRDAVQVYVNQKGAFPPIKDFREIIIKTIYNNSHNIPVSFLPLNSTLISINQSIIIDESKYKPSGDKMNVAANTIFWRLPTTQKVGIGSLGDFEIINNWWIWLIVGLGSALAIVGIIITIVLIKRKKKNEENW